MLKYINPFFFWMRCVLKIKSGEVKLRFEEKVFSADEQVKKEEKLRNTYELGKWYQTFGQIDYQLLLYRLELMEKAIGEDALPNLVHAVDVGSTNFYYAAALHQYYQKKSKLEKLEGLEVDAYRVYDNFHSRFDYAKAYTKGLEKATYIPIDFLDYQEKMNVITMFLPFVFEEPLLIWGLPLKKYQPLSFMKHAYELLEEGGIWIVTNQGKEEQKKQHELLETLNILYEDKGEFRSCFYTYQIAHYVTIIKKPN
jgi:hypothetical protein